MVNKMKFWRKTAKKQSDGSRNGRELRNYMSSSPKGGMLNSMHIWLFRAAGITTPVYDAQQKQYLDFIKSNSEKSTADMTVSNNTVSDVEFTEGTV